MLIIIFTYQREDMLKALLKELKGYDVIVIDDGSDWSANHSKRPGNCQFIRARHDGKKGFWRKWIMAQNLFLSSKHEYVCFMADDWSKIQIKDIDALTEQDWDNKDFAVNIANDGRESCWNKFRTNQKPFAIGDIKYHEVGFVDCGFLTNRKTMSRFRVDQVPKTWFNKEGKSSGVGYQITHKFRKLGVAMMTPTPSLCFHGDHKSVMHPNERLSVPLKTIHK